jgi:hypothetical protein
MSLWLLEGSAGWKGKIRGDRIAERGGDFAASSERPERASAKIGEAGERAAARVRQSTPSRIKEVEPRRAGGKMCGVAGLGKRREGARSPAGTSGTSRTSETSGTSETS